MIPVLYHAFHPTIKAKSPNAKVFIQPSEVKGLEGCVGALAKNVVMLDIDNAQDLAAFERILAYTKVRVPTMITPHGKHFYFLANEKVVENNFTRGLLACGVVADVKVGAKNGFDCVKQQGDRDWRKWENEDASLIPFPAFCKPVLKGNKAQEQGSFTQSHEGSRNDKLFSFITALKNGGFDYKSTLALCRMINRVVMPEPMPEAEVDTICRPEAYQSAYMNHRKKNKVFFDGTNSGEGATPSAEGLDPEEVKLSPIDQAKMVLGLDTIRMVDGNLYIKDGQIVSLDHVGDALLELQHGKVEAVPAQRVVAQQYLIMNPAIADSGVIFEGADSASAVAVPKGNDDLLKLINEVIKENQQAGNFEKWTQECSELAVKNAQK